MHRPRVENVTFWRATRCGFAKHCSKMPIKLVKWLRFGDFFEKPPKSGSSGFGRYQMWLFTINLQILTILQFFFHFCVIFGKTTSGSSPKCDIFNPWAVHVWTPDTPTLKKTLNISHYPFYNFVCKYLDFRADTSYKRYRTK